MIHPLIINVTHKDIRGAGNDGGSCPVQRAFVRQYPSIDVWVTQTEIKEARSVPTFGSDEMYRTYGERRIAQLPAKAQRRIVAYDKGSGMEPFQFEIEADL